LKKLLKKSKQGNKKHAFVIKKVTSVSLVFNIPEGMIKYRSVKTPQG